jgi:hypothetical protein
MAMPAAAPGSKYKAQRRLRCGSERLRGGGAEGVGHRFRTPAATDRAGQGPQGSLCDALPRIVGTTADWYRIARPAVWLFPGRKSDAADDDAAVQSCRSHRRRHGRDQEARDTHTLRHSFATHLSLRRSSALVMPFARAISSNASPRGRGTSVLTWTTGDRLLVTICAGCFLMRPSPPESDSDGILSELFVEPTERWHLRHVPLAWRHPPEALLRRKIRAHLGKLGFHKSADGHSSCLHAGEGTGVQRHDLLRRLYRPP